MTQYVINIGALPNDGTGDPLRTAFNETNLNFDQVFAAGPVLSNVRIANNSILTTNTNGNLVLAPNGTGVVQSNVNIVPNASNIRNLGSNTQRWSTLYVQYANISGNIDLAGAFSVGELAVTGNLTVTGNTIQIGNLITDAKTIQLANTASTTSAANGSGITVGANDNIATMLYSSTSNTWAMNIGVSTVGNITASYFIGNGSQLTGLPEAYGNSNVATFLATFGSNAVSTTGNVSAGYLFGNASQLTGLPPEYGNSNVATFMSTFGSNSISTTGNITASYFSGNIPAADGNTTVQFNVGGYLGAAAGFSYDTGGNTLYVETISLQGKLGRGVESLYAGVSGFTPLGSDVVAQLAGNVNGYTQINFQNISSEAQASGDYIITANNGTDSTHFIDLGITGNNWDGTQPNSLGNNVGPNDGYLYVQDGNLILGVSNGSQYIWRFDATGNLVLPPSGNIVGTTANISAGNLTTGGDISATGDIIGNIIGANSDLSAIGNVIGTTVVTDPVNLGSLTAVAGARTFINDGNLVAAGNFGAQIGAGGSNTVPVWSDGTNWYIG